MIRINLLGRSRPKASRSAVPIEATLQWVFLAVALVVSVGVLYGHYLLMDRENTAVLAHIQKSLALVMALESPELDPEESLSNLGLDSLMALELQHSLEESFGAKLPIELLMGIPSLNEFANRLLEILAKAESKPRQEISQEIIVGESKINEGFPPIVEA